MLVRTVRKIGYGRLRLAQAVGEGPFARKASRIEKPVS